MTSPIPGSAPTADATKAARAPRRRRPLLQRAAALALALAGWRLEGQVPAEPRFVAIVAPHTSNWDFVIGVMAMFALDLRVHWFGKDALFRTPLAPLFRRLGGRPVNRDTPMGVVDEMSATVRAERQFILALAPEGTRRRVTRWRTGFYRIAERVGVPIVPVSLDWGARAITVGAPFHTTGRIDEDIAALMRFYHAGMARDPRGFWTARP